MAEPYDSSVAFTKKRIDDIRAKIVQLKDAINAHIGEGGNLHPIITSISDGDMLDYDYKEDFPDTGDSTKVYHSKKIVKKGEETEEDHYYKWCSTVYIEITSCGFMYYKDFKILNTELEEWYQKVLAAMRNSKIPAGTTCWYYGDPNDLPPGWHLTSANSLNALYKITTQTNGGSVKGVLSKSENPGTEESISGKESVGNKINTIALYSIRRDDYKEGEY